MTETAPYVLIVEDDPLFQEVYRTRLEQQGFQVKVVGDGEEAWREIESFPPDVILLDLVLPRLSGHDVLARLKANPQLAELPVIVLTSRGEPADIERGKQEGAEDYLIKGSTNPKEVIWKVKQALAKKSGQPLALRVALQEKLLDAPLLADMAKKSEKLQCGQCARQLLLELTPQTDRPGWFDARLVCPDCGK
jgi:DNA-binding response OmpR family regulator